jgi:outer membrane protein assembly factor BamB
VRSRFATGCLLATTVLLFCIECDEHATIGVRIASGPTHVALGEPASFVVKLTYSSFFYKPTSRIRMEWGDKTTETSGPVTAGDSVLFKHAWQKSGNYQVTAVALADQQPRSSAWALRVSSLSDPVVDSAQFNYLWRPIELVVYAHDPEGDSLRLFLSWSDGHEETTGLVAGPGRLGAGHRFAGSGPCSVVFEVSDKSGGLTAPETLAGVCSTSGEVTWYRRGTFAGSPAVADSVVYITGSEYLYGFRQAGSDYFWPASFTGDLAFSSQTSRLYAGMQDGHLRALTHDLVPVWRYPADETITSRRWGPVAVKGNSLYVPCSDDSIYCLTDNDTSATRVAAFGAVQVEAVVLDSAGNVYFGDGEGGLSKLTAGLDLAWRVQLQADGTIYPPVIGTNGTIHCASSTNHHYAVSVDGSVQWDVTLAGTCRRPVVGTDGLFAGTDAGTLYKLDLGSGAMLWQSRIGPRPLDAAPILVTGGYAYVQTEEDRLYCVSQSTGDSVWVCNTSKYLPSQPQAPAPRFVDGVSSPAVDANGRVYVVGSEALFKLSTYEPLDAASPWPKWQHDAYNTGYVEGGR